MNGAWLWSKPVFICCFSVTEMTANVNASLIIRIFWHVLRAVGSCEGLQLRVFVASHFRCLTHLIYVIYCQALHALLTLLIHAPFAHFFACVKITSGWIFSPTKTFCWYYKPCCFYEGSKKVMNLFEVGKFFKHFSNMKLF